MNRKYFALSLVLATSLIHASQENNPAKISVTENSALEKRMINLDAQLKNMKPTASSARSSMRSALRITKVGVIAFGLGLFADKINKESEGFTKFPHFSTQDIQNYGAKISSQIQTAYSHATEKSQTTPKQYRNPYESNHTYQTKINTSASRSTTHDEVAEFANKLAVELAEMQKTQNTVDLTTGEAINQGGGDNEKRD